MSSPGMQGNRTAAALQGKAKIVMPALPLFRFRQGTRIAPAPTLAHLRHSCTLLSVLLSCAWQSSAAHVLTHNCSGSEVSLRGLSADGAPSGSVPEAFTAASMAASCSAAGTLHGPAAGSTAHSKPPPVLPRTSALSSTIAGPAALPLLLPQGRVARPLASRR